MGSAVGTGAARNNGSRVALPVVLSSSALGACLKKAFALSYLVAHRAHPPPAVRKWAGATSAEGTTRVASMPATNRTSGRAVASRGLALARTHARPVLELLSNSPW